MLSVNFKNSLLIVCIGLNLISCKTDLIVFDTLKNDNAPVIPVFSSVHTGRSGAFAITNTGQFMAWGRTHLGNGVSWDTQEIPIYGDNSALNVGEEFTHITGGEHIACALTNQNRTFCWGDNSRGQLGIGDPSPTYEEISPVLVDTSALNVSEYFTTVDAGYMHVCGITNQNRVFCWGRNTHGQLGDNDTPNDKDVPTLVDGTNLASNEYFTSISLGYFHTCGLTNLSNAFCWGSDIAEQLGNGGLGDQDIPGLVNITNLGTERLTTIDAGYFMNCGLSDGNKMYCWGDEYTGNLGDGGGNTDQSIPVIYDDTNLNIGEHPLSLAIGWDGGCFVTNQNNVYCWGGDSFEEIGDGGPSTDQDSAVLIDSSNLANGEYFAKIDAGAYYRCGITNQLNIYCWGMDGDEQLGDGAGGTHQSRPALVDRSNL